MFSETMILKADTAVLTKAAQVLTQGNLVAFPTETVYGLGADACNDAAVARIYQAKGRPSFNPLIVHVADVVEARKLVEWNDDADRLACAFWPGPLTLVLPLRNNSQLAKSVTAGHPSVAVRIPGHPVALELLRAFGGPLAAPSANPSGKISPTTAEHVAAGLGRAVDLILDDGPCKVGLESTIVGLTGHPKLLRPGGISVELLEDALGQKKVAPFDNAAPITAPGQIKSHYAPGAFVRLNADGTENDEVLLGFGPMECDLNLSKSGDLSEAAANLFRHLHALDQRQVATIAVAPIPEKGIGKAINDRLRRAAAPRD